jgi:hypothetical protein
MGENFQVLIASRAVDLETMKGLSD